MKTKNKTITLKLTIDADLTENSLSNKKIQQAILDQVKKAVLKNKPVEKKQDRLVTIESLVKSKFSVVKESNKYMLKMVNGKKTTTLLISSKDECESISKLIQSGIDFFKGNNINSLKLESDETESCDHPELGKYQVIFYSEEGPCWVIYQNNEKKCKNFVEQILSGLKK